MEDVFLCPSAPVASAFFRPPHRARTDTIMRNLFQKLREVLKTVGKTLSDGVTRLSAKPFRLAIVMALGVAFLNEVLSRRSLWQAVVFTVTKPLLFFANASIVMLFLAFALLFKRRQFLLCFFSLLCLAMGITNFVVQCFKVTPFSAMDFTLVMSVFPILPRYLTWPGVILMGLALLALFAYLFYRFLKAKKHPVDPVRGIVLFLATIGASVLFIGSGHLFGLFPKHFSNLATAYRSYGFTYCFSVSIFDRGIDKPDDYDDDAIHGILSDISADTTDGEEDPPDHGPTDRSPNVIVVQLESFIDPTVLSGFAFSEDPIPVFRSLCEQFQSGLLTVPSIGAGTANTEFEVLSGMSLQWFGAGEYPYETVLQKKTCESLPFNLKEHGYVSHAVHNYKGNFYDRNDVFSHLGFDTFTSLEYMNGVTYNPTGWAKDDVLVRYVMESLTSTEEADLVYCITVQGHGKYPTEPDKNAPASAIRTEICPEGADPESFTYFVNQLRETDAFIKTLLDAIKATEEETYVVLFGDHLPNIGIREEWLPKGRTLYDTEYVIWHSEGERAPDRNLTSYQLSAALMTRLGHNTGVITQLHQTWADKKDYLVYLEMLQYDILYGQNFCYGGQSPFLPTEIKMGVLDITIDRVSVQKNGTYVYGTNFTPASRIFVNGFQHTPTFVDESTLLLEKLRLDGGDTLRVAQITDGIFQLSTTDTFVCPETAD